MDAKNLHMRSLKTVFKFDERDLEANRQGQLTKKQRERLLRTMLTTTIVCVIGIAVTLFLSRATDDIPPTSPNLIGSIVVLILCYLLITTFIQFSRDIQQNKVKRICGFVFLDAIGRYGPGYHLKYRRRSVRYQLQIHKMLFHLRKDHFLALRHNEPYCIYYAPSSESILSIEAQ